MHKSIVLCGSVLLIAMGLQIAAGLRRNEEESLREHPGEFFPRTTRWWTSEQPVADTPEMAKAVGELLNFDDAVLRIYRKGTQRFEVYAAFWRPGKMSERLVAGHTPDICWSAAGWTCVSRQPPRPQVVASAGFQKEGQYRIFRDPEGALSWVVFWHAARGKFVRYEGGEKAPPWWTVFTELAEHGLEGRGGQRFLRISSNVPWEELVLDPEFRAVAAAAGGMLK